MDITSKRFTATIHIIFWICYFLLNGASYARFVGLPDIYEKTLITGGIHMSIVYINQLVLLRRYFFKRKFTIYLLLATPLFWGTIFLLLLVMNNWFTGNGRVADIFILENIFTATVTTFITLALPALLTFLQEWYKQQKKNRELAYNQLQAEHKMLRMQVNPHFLFNALNNIYSLAYKKDDATAPAILKLGELMRYLLYDSEAKRVPLQTEVDYIKNYIGLQELKYTDTDKIRFHTENISPVLIDPLLFIPFVENAFKHGNLAEEDAFLDIRITLKDYALEFKVSNSFNPEDQVKDEAGGVGIENVRNRLKAYYPDKHHLEIKNDGHIYTVHLQIQL